MFERDQSLVHLDATAVLERLKTRSVSAEELVGLCYERIDAAREPINAVVLERRDEALAEARVADEARAGGDESPLLGLPVTVKESFDITGLPTTWGLPDFADAPRETNSAVAQSLVDAGAILLGKTNVPVMLANYEAANPVYGVTNNPHNPSRTPGGSSGGAAAAIATGQTFLECGSDIGGSIRQPADSCGVFAIKPTWGVIPQSGHVPPGAPETANWFIDSEISGQLAAVGPITRSARDLRLGMDALVSPYRLGPHAAAWEHDRSRERGLRDFRVGLVLDHPDAPVQTLVGDVLQELVDALASRGTTLSEGWPADVDPNHMRDLRFYFRGSVEALMPPDAIAERVARSGSLPAFPAGDFDALIDRGLTDTFAGRAARELERQHYHSLWERYFGDIDVFLMPVQTHTAFRHGEFPDGLTEADHFWWAPGTLLGMPCVVAPVGTASDGMPVGVQIMGNRYADHTAIAFARALEREGLSAFTRPTGW